MSDPNEGAQRETSERAGGGASGAKTPRFDVTSLGESLIRLSVGAGERLATARALDVHVAGAESNVCAALAGLGRRCGWSTKLPDNPLGNLVLRRAREWGVDIGGVIMAPEGRVGTYYVELATPPLPARVTYDREGSTVRNLTSSEVDWDYLLDTRILHLTGITAALGPSLQAIVTEAVTRAKERGVLVSFDVNYRESLWPAEEAARALLPLIREADVLFCGRKDAIRLFGAQETDATQLVALQELTDAHDIVMSLGRDGAIATSAGRVFRRPAMPVRVIDRIGAGDALAAGVLDGLLEGDLERGLTLGIALASYALSLHGDVVTVDRREIDSLARGLAADVIR